MSSGERQDRVEEKRQGVWRRRTRREGGEQNMARWTQSAVSASELVVADGY